MKSIKRILISTEYVDRIPTPKLEIESTNFCIIETFNTVEINRTGQYILTKSKTGEMKFETKITIPMGVSDLVERLAAIINQADWVGFEKKEPSAEEQKCKVIVEYYNSDTIEFKTKYTQESMPENWMEFGEEINDWVHFYGYKSIIDIDNFYHCLKDGEIIYLSCCFDESGYGKTYYYRTLDDRVCEGDEVIVPVGEANRPTSAWVEKKEFFKPEDVPMPIDKVKEIIRLVDDEEHDDDGADDDTIDMINNELFAEPNFGWGARGNPHLWEELLVHFCDIGLPSTAEDFEKSIIDYIEKKIGKPFTEDTFVKEYDTGGMSSGMITPTWWKEMGIPELLVRYRKYMK